MSKSPRKSIVASFGLLSAELESDKGETAPPPRPSLSPASNRVGAGVVGAAHRAIDDIRTERDELRALIEAGGGMVRELDPALIDPSPYPDRLPDDDAADFDAFKRLIETEGQKVPIQVRKHPSAAGRYQIIYGHRRWLAAKQLGKSVRAIEVDISDLDLVVAQGIENGNRQDLTWIERALFASRMDSAGIKPRVIYSALSIEDTELARMRSVYRQVPVDIIESIGRAPKVGRPRWLELAKIFANDPKALTTVRATLSQRSGKKEGSDQRFRRALSSVKSDEASADSSVPISDGHGAIVGLSVVSGKELRISAQGERGPNFIKYLESQLPVLAERFSQTSEAENP